MGFWPVPREVIFDHLGSYLIVGFWRNSAPEDRFARILQRIPEKVYTLSGNFLRQRRNLITWGGRRPGPGLENGPKKGHFLKMVKNQVKIWPGFWSFLINLIKNDRIWSIFLIKKWSSFGQIWSGSGSALNRSRTSSWDLDHRISNLPPQVTSFGH